MEPDHHLVLAMADGDYESGDPEALEAGMRREVYLPGWVDLFPLSEVERLRAVGTVVWKREAGIIRDLDSLDFRFRWSPISASREVLKAFATLVEAVPAVVRVEGTDQRLWKADRVIEHTTRFFVDLDRRRGCVDNAITLVAAASRETGLANPDNNGTGWGLPSDPAIETTVLYDATM